jgi:hypothetical protein
MTRKYRQFTETQSQTDFAQQFCDTCYSVTLSATTDTSLTVPGTTLMGVLTSYNKDPVDNGNNKVRAIIRSSAASNVWVALNATAAVPAGNTFATTTSELVNGDYAIARDVIVGDVIHFYTAASNVVVSVSFYALAA